MFYIRSGHPCAIQAFEGNASERHCMSPTQRSSQISALRDYYRIHRGTSQVLVELFHADAPLPIGLIAARCEMSAVGVKVRISELRAVMDEGCVDTVGAYYSLTAKGRVECRQALVTIATDLMQAMIQPQLAEAA